MTEERKIIPYKIAKGNRPNIDEVIENCIYGEIQENAKNFVAWLKENGMTFQKHSTTTRQHYATYKKQRFMQIGFWDERIDFNHVSKHFEGDPQYWGINWCIPAKVYKSLEDNKITAVSWDLIKCGHCKPIETCTGIRIINPDRAAVEMIKELILLSICDIDEKPEVK